MVSLQDVRIVRAPIERCFDLARSVEAHVAGNVHSGEATIAAAGSLRGCSLWETASRGAGGISASAGA
jgi:hypothetical protein